MCSEEGGRLKGGHGCKWLQHKRGRSKWLADTVSKVSSCNSHVLHISIQITTWMCHDIKAFLRCTCFFFECGGSNTRLNTPGE